MKICVFGAGATGGHFAVRLAEAGHEVSVVARGAHLEAIRANGLTLKQAGKSTNVRVRATERAGELGAQDAVIMGVKATGLKAAAPDLTALLGPETVVVFPQNGMPWWYPVGLDDAAPTPPDLPVFGLAAEFRPHLGDERIAGGVIYSANVIEAPGVILNNTPRRNALVISAVGPSAAPGIAALRAALVASGIESDAPEDIRRIVWRKLLLNMSASTLALATGTRSSIPRDDERLAETFRRILAEGLAIAAAHGHDLTAETDAGRLLAGMPDHKPSILQDYEQGRPMEIGEIVLAPAAFARAAGVATPTLDAVAAIVTRLALDRGLYPAE
ncbi:MAG: 2-dehydropantoate 2-reductase [Paracoccaceae bacterium]